MQITEATARYAAGQLGNGASPAEAAAIARFTAGELVSVAVALARLGWVDPAERREAARRMVAAGMSRAEVAGVLGTSESMVGKWVRSR